MSPRRPAGIATLALLYPLASLALARELPAQTTECVNLRPDGLALHAAAATSCSMSADGRYVAFATPSAVLLPGAPGYSSIYVRDRTSGVLSLASVNSAGQPASLAAFDALISAQGRHVAFSSPASNLDPNATNLVQQVFVHDRQTGTTVLASASSSGAAASSQCVATSISADGRHVAFETAAALIPADTNAMSDVYVRDTLAGTTTRVSVSTTGAESAGNCVEGRISADGNRIVFVAAADDLVVGDINGLADALVHDRATGTTTLASVSTSGAQANAAVTRVGISGDGATVLLVSASSTLDPALVGGGHSHVFARDLAAGTTRMLDVNAGGSPGNQSVSLEGPWHAPRCSHDGRHVVFTSRATNLVAGDSNNAPDVFQVDRATDTVTRASLGTCGQQQDMDNGQVFSAGVSDDGLFVSFTSPAENLVAGDSSGGENNDVFVRDTTKPALGFDLCTAEDGAPCPCGGTNYPVRGCINGNEATGLFVSGEARIGADTLRFGAYELPHGSNLCILYQGTQPIAGNTGVAFGDGVRCVGGQIVRLVSRPNTWHEGFYYPLLGDVPVSQLNPPPTPGSTVYYQLWHTSPGASFCTPSAFNFSNAVGITWQP